MTRSISPWSRFIALFAALLIFPLLAVRSGHPDLSGAAQKQNHFVISDIHAHADLALSAVLQTERESSPGVVRYTAGRSSGKYGRSLTLHYLLTAAAGLLTFGCYAFLISFFAKEETVFSRRYILKYIHDQDGHKDAHSDLFTGKAAENKIGGTYHGHWKNTHDRILCALLRGDDLRRDFRIP